MLLSRTQSFLIALLLAFVLTTPFVVHAQGFLQSIVPCGGTYLVEGPVPGVGEQICVQQCTVCHLVELARNIINFFIFLGVVLATLLFVNAGVLYVTSSTNPGNVAKAHRIFLNTLVGLIVVLAAWLIVDVVMKVLYDEGETPSWGAWNEILCKSSKENRQCTPTKSTFPTPSLSSSHVAANSYTNAGEYVVGNGTYDSDGINAAYSGTQQYENDLRKYSEKYGVPYEDVRTIMMIESAGRPDVINTCNSKGACGIMQMKPETALGLDPSLGSVAAARDKLTSDPAYAIDLGVKNYSTMLNRFDGNRNYAAAAYNAGSGSGTNANGTKQPFAPSSNCPGLYAWQCSWNSNGCYGTGRTDCVPEKGFAETRRYVDNFNQLTAHVESTNEDI